MTVDRVLKNKDLLRAKSKAFRKKGLNLQAISNLNNNLIILLKELRPRRVAAYLARSDEPGVDKAIRYCAASNIYVMAPIVSGNSLLWGYIVQNNALKSNKFNILEPVKANANLFDADAIIVPSLASDLKGARLGKGGGFYDRALYGLKTPKICISMESEIYHSIPSQSHDIKVDYIVSEKRIIDLS